MRNGSCNARAIIILAFNSVLRMHPVIFVYVCQQLQHRSIFTPFGISDFWIQGRSHIHTYISIVKSALFSGISGSFTGLPVVSSSVNIHIRGAAFLYAFFIEQPHNTGTIARTANNIFFICVSSFNILMLFIIAYTYA